MISNVKNINIKKSILHIINGQNSYYNTSLLPNTDEEFNTFLKKHIRSSARAKARKTAKFKTSSSNPTLESFESMFQNEENFIIGSKELAQRLKGICQSKNHGPFDLILCEYENEDEETFIAVILLEFTTGFFHEVNETSDEALIRHYTVLASSSSSLKKCALISEYKETDDYNILLNDKNISDFFVIDFLRSEIFMDNRKATEIFIEKTITWVNTKCNEQGITAEEKAKLEEVKSECISSINRNATLDIDAFQNLLFKDEISTYKDEYNIYLEHSGLLCKEIILSDDVTNDYKFNKIKLDNNTEIKIPIDLISYQGNDNNYNRTHKDDGNTEFILKGKVIDESVKLR